MRKHVVSVHLLEISKYLLNFPCRRKKVVFSLRSVFCIDQVEKVEDMYYIDITAIDEDDQESSTGANPWK